MLGREPSVSATVARLLLASDNSEARSRGTILAMPCPPKTDSANAVVRRSAELAIACVANQESQVPEKQQHAGCRPRSAIRLAHLPGEAAVPPGGRDS
jgi:hypothetical protein